MSIKCNQWVLRNISEYYQKWIIPRPHHTSKMGLSVKKINVFKMFYTFTKSPILEVWRSLEFASDFINVEKALKSDSHLSKRFCVICLIESALEVTKNAFNFILKSLFVLKIFGFLSQSFGHLGKMAWLER